MLHRVVFVVALVCAAICLFGCDAPPTATPDTPPPQSRWGTIITLGDSVQRDAPTLHLSGAHVSLAWVGIDDAGVHHDVAQIQNQQRSPIATLPLNPVRPEALRQIALMQDTQLLFYLDADENGETRLFNAAFTPDNALKHGRTLISTHPTTDYALATQPDHTVWIVWRSLHTLYVQWTDALGRPRAPLKLQDDVLSAALHTDANGALMLYWLDQFSPYVYRGKLTEDGLTDVRAYSPAPRLQTGDHLVDFGVGADHTHTYLFWNIRHADGNPTIQWAAIHHSAPATTHAPAPLGIAASDDLSVITGFNGGTAYQAQAGDTPLTWIYPAAGHFETLVTAAQLDNQLSMVYFQGGALIGFQPVVTLSNALIGAPHVGVDAQRHLHLAWAEPRPTHAKIAYTTTKP